MQNETRLKFNALSAQIAKVNGVPSASKKFNVQPSIQQKMENRIQETAEYLQWINVEGVTEKSGEKLHLGISGPSASRTDTRKDKRRQPRDLTDIDAQDYVCNKTNFDTSLPYNKIDAWAKFPDFQTKVSGMLMKQQGLDRLMIGWNGTSVAEDTDFANNQLLQDVNKGWLQILREQAPAQVMTEGKLGAKEVRVGPGGHYENLDAMVYDAILLLAPWYQEDNGLRVHLGRKLMHEKYFPQINQQQRATDELATQTLVSQKAIGGLSGLSLPYFPGDKILITRPDNLSIYYQIGGRRRYIRDEPDYDRIADYQSSNDAYVVEHLAGAVLIENIVLGNWLTKPPAGG
jgi:P2 family phage major capsid protein